MEYRAGVYHAQLVNNKNRKQIALSYPPRPSQLANGQARHEQRDEDQVTARIAAGDGAGRRPGYCAKSAWPAAIRSAWAAIRRASLACPAPLSPDPGCRI